MRKVDVADVKPILGASVGTIIGITDGSFVYVVADKRIRDGEWCDFIDKDGKVCRLYVRQFSKIPAGQIERKKW
jgi:hypothetical protein